MQRKSVFKTIKLMTATTVIALGIFIPAKSKAIAAEPVNQYLQLDNNGWRYYSNNQLDTSFKGLVPNEYGWWYVENGTIDFNYTGLAYDENVGWWYVENGAINFNYNGLKCNEAGWFKITNGMVDFGYTGLAYDENVGWWYVENGAINFNYNGLKCNEAGWFKITNGMVDFGYTGLAYDDIVGWWYVEDGAINFNYNGLADNEYGNWKITNGLVDFGYNGTYDGKEIVNGCIVSEEFDGYDRFGNKFIEEFDGERYYKYFDADNPYILDTYEWTDDGRCISVIKDLGVCSYSEADDRFVDMWDGIENQLMDECYKKNPDKQCVSDVTSLGCYNGHWLIEFRCVSVDTMYISVELNRKYNHLYPLYFYDKEGNLRI